MKAIGFIVVINTCRDAQREAREREERGE